MKRFMSKRAAVVGIAVGLTLGMSGAAFAFWTTGGTGSGSATAGTTSNISVIQTSATASSLYPGGPTESLFGNFTNPNPGGIHITAVIPAVTGVTNGNSDVTKPACLTTDFYISGTFGPYTVPPGTNVGAWSGLSIGLVNRDGVINSPTEISPAANQDNCKGAIAVITYTVTP
jgi:hypothetical protein